MTPKRKHDIDKNDLDETFPLIGVRMNKQGRKQFVIDTKFGAIVAAFIVSTASAGGEGIERVLNFLLSLIGG